MRNADYDRIGLGYATQRVPDPRIAAQIWRALGDATHVCNVGAGTGSYEPHACRVVAVEPSRAMIAQRRNRRVVLARAEALPFREFLEQRIGIRHQDAKPDRPHFLGVLKLTMQHHAIAAQADVVARNLPILERQREAESLDELMARLGVVVEKRLGKSESVEQQASSPLC